METNKNEMIAKGKQVKPEDAVFLRELETNAINTITALINQANTIATENLSKDKPVGYDDVDDPTIYITITEEKKGEARVKYNDLKEMKKSHFWTIGRNKAKAEKTQDVLIDVIDAVDNNVNATKALFNNQMKLADFSRKLYGIGLMSIASNRIIVREIQMRLEHASKEELTDLARQELENVLSELKRQQRIEEKVEHIEKEQAEKLLEMKQTLDASSEELKKTSTALQKKQDAFITKSQQEIASAHEDFGKIQKEAFELLRRDNEEQLSTMRQQHTEEANRINEIIDQNTKSEQAFINEQTTLMATLKKQMMIYKIISICAIGVSFITLLYAIVS